MWRVGWRIERYWVISKSSNMENQMEGKGKVDAWKSGGLVAVGTWNLEDLCSLRLLQ